MPLYFFSLSDDVWPYHSGEDLPNDEAAKAHAELVEAELSRNDPAKFRIRVFNAEGKRVS